MSHTTVSTGAQQETTKCNARRRFQRASLAGVWVVALLAAGSIASSAANEVLMWNEIALKTAAAGGQNPLQVTRTLAMVQAAVHDALNAITRRYAAYFFEGPGAPTPRRMLPSPRPLTRS